MARGTENDAASVEPGELLLRFVNTRPITRPSDELADAQVAKRWFIENDLVEADALVTETDASAARELRIGLVALLKSHVGVEDTEESQLAERILGRAATTHLLAPRIGSTRAEFVSLQDGVAGALGTILAQAATVALDEREWSRFKACKNPACFRGFRDNSRNGSALYCSHTCSSQVSMRAYRQRKAD